MMRDYIDLGNNYYFFPFLDKIARSKIKNPNFCDLDKELGEIKKNFDKNPFVDLKSALPIEISLFISAACNMKCSYCYYSSGENNIEQELSKKDLDSIISYLIRNAKIRVLTNIKPNKICITLTGGGEPTCNWNNFEYFVTEMKLRAKANNIEVAFFLVTNGVLNLQKRLFIYNNIDYIQISYDGLKMIQNSNRVLRNGRSSASQVEESMKFFSEKGKTLYIRTTVQPRDYMHIYEMALNIFENYPSVLKYHIEPLQFTGRGEKLEKDSAEDNDIFIREYIKTQKVILQKYPNKHFYCSLFTYKTQIVSCSSITGVTPIINNRGVIYPCSDRLNVETQSLGKFVNGQLIDYKENFYKSVYNKIKKTECNNCNYFSLCGGGCFSTFKRDHKGELLPEGKLKCDLLKKYWDIAFKSICSEHKFLDIYLENKENTSAWDIYNIGSHN